VSDTAKTILSDSDPNIASQGSSGETTRSGGETTKRTAVISPIPDVVLESELGRGGMGVVYRGRQIYLERAVAVKLLLVDGANGQEFVQRFQREAKILASLAHPNIVSCYQAGVTAANCPYLVMEFINGPTLKDWVITHGRVAVRDALALTRDLAKALDHAHDSGIIHRGVKPENVLLAPSAREAAFPFIAKLVDLGLARSSRASGDMQLTRQGTIMGTPATMAPEQFDDPENVDYRADIYGLGCVLYHALIGKPAFDGQTIAAIITAKVSGEVPQATRAKADIPLAVNELVCALLARNRDQRPQSYREIIERCNVLLHGDAQQLGKHGNRSAWIGVAAAVVLFGGSALAWTLKSTTTNHAATTATTLPSAAVVVPQVGLDKLSDADFGAKRPLWLFDQAQRLSEWSSDPHWVSSEDRADAVSGLSGRITRALPSLPCRIHALIHHATGRKTGDAHSDTAQIGVQLANGGRVELTLLNLGPIIHATTNCYKSGKDIPHNSQGPLTFPAGKPIPVTLTIGSDALIAAVDGNRLTLIALPAAPERLCLTANLKAPLEALPIEISALTVQLRK
jgi:serine/threonine protein kinase